jgi:hypothetical protein
MECDRDTEEASGAFATSDDADSVWKLVEMPVIVRSVGVRGQDRCEFVLDVDAELDRQVGYVRPHDGSQLAQRLEQRLVDRPWTRSHRWTASESSRPDLSHEPTARCSHRYQMRAHLLVRLGELTDLGGVPEYHGTGEILWEAASTIWQG